MGDGHLRGCSLSFLLRCLVLSSPLQSPFLGGPAAGLPTVQDWASLTSPPPCAPALGSITSPRHLPFLTFTLPAGWLVPLAGNHSLVPSLLNQPPARALALGGNLPVGLQWKLVISVAVMLQLPAGGCHYQRWGEEDSQQPCHYQRLLTLYFPAASLIPLGSPALRIRWGWSVSQSPTLTPLCARRASDS